MPPASQPASRSSYPSSPPLRTGSGEGIALAKIDLDRLDEIPAEASFLEFDALEWSRFDARARGRFQKRLMRARLGVIPRLNLRWIQEPEAVQDLLDALLDKLKPQIGFVIMASGRKQCEDGSWRTMARPLVRFRESAGIPVFFEWGEEDSALTVRESIESGAVEGWVLDPHWHRKALPKVKVPVHFKLHGWHPERWMRRYGEKLGQDIVKNIRRFPYSVLILAHSGRVIEAVDFARWRSE
ncbi:MAG: hypothetical protein EBX52_10325 [Proteobacteria bacterium]|nr:hypothetical protein [Pseudomonadota bacterium]